MAFAEAQFCADDLTFCDLQAKDLISAGDQGGEGVSWYWIGFKCMQQTQGEVWRDEEKTSCSCSPDPTPRNAARLLGTQTGPLFQS